MSKFTINIDEGRCFFCKGNSVKFDNTLHICSTCFDILNKEFIDIFKTRIYESSITYATPRSFIENKYSERLRENRLSKIDDVLK